MPVSQAVCHDDLHKEMSLATFSTMIFCVFTGDEGLFVVVIVEFFVASHFKEGKDVSGA